jgi:hypothetical protein
MHDPVSEPLLEGLAEGRDEAFAALYDRYGRSLFRVAWTLLRSRQDAEDAVQDVFLGLARSRANLARVENLRAYLFGALRHAARAPRPPGSATKGTRSTLTCPTGWTGPSPPCRQSSARCSPSRSTGG